MRKKLGKVERFDERDFPVHEHDFLEYALHRSVHKIRRSMGYPRERHLFSNPMRRLGFFPLASLG